MARKHLIWQWGLLLIAWIVGAIVILRWGYWRDSGSSEIHQVNAEDIAITVGKLPSRAGLPSRIDAATNSATTSDETERPGEVTAPLPARVQSWLHERLSIKSFATGIALLKDQSLSEQARVLVLDKLHSWRRYLSPANLKTLFAEAESIARDGAQPKQLRARAVNAMATILIVLQEQTLFTHAEVKAYSSFFADLSQAENTDFLVRGRAIRALGIMKADNAGRLLRELLAAPENVDNPELARNACLALAQVDGAAAVPTIDRVLETTSDGAVYGTAAFALGQIQTPEALASLVHSEPRFPSSGSADAALVNMEGLILQMLRSPDDPNAAAAVEATRHLWKEGQRDRYTPLLRSLVADGPPMVQQAAVGRLIEDSRSLPLEEEQQALSLILPAIANNPQLASYAQQIQNRLNAKPVVPNAAPISIVGRPR